MESSPSLFQVDEAELSQLFTEYGPGQRWKIALEVSAQPFEDWLQKLINKGNRRGEVVLAIQRSAGEILLHTKRFYPEGVFRLPSGGIHPGEPVLSGVIRESKEETGLEVSVKRLLGIVEYEFSCSQSRFYFVSYVFLVQAGDDLPVVQDTQEQISDFCYVHPAQIRAVAAQLRALPPEWADWGRFRAVPHDLVADALGA